MMPLTNYLHDSVEGVDVFLFVAICSFHRNTCSSLFLTVYKAELVANCFCYLFPSAHPINTLMPDASDASANMVLNRLRAHRTRALRFWRRMHAGVLAGPHNYTSSLLGQMLLCLLFRDHVFF